MAFEGDYYKDWLIHPRGYMEESMPITCETSFLCILAHCSLPRPMLDLPDA